jgi:hypothetical protein
MGGLPEALSVEVRGAAVGHEPETVMTTSAEVVIRIDFPVSREARSSIPGLWRSEQDQRALIHCSARSRSLSCKEVPRCVSERAEAR